MPLPTKAKTWVISPNNRITFVSLLDTMQRYLYGVKAFLKTNGYTVKGSASAGTGAMDAVDRWTLTTDVTPRATVAAASQAWIVLTDANGCDILLTYQGASDDIARISYSATGVFVAAGTPSQQPTATDEMVLYSATSLILSTASADRLWSGWVSSDAKMCRFAVARSGTFVGATWGVELVTSAVTSPSASFTPPVWGHHYLPANIGDANGASTALSSGRGANNRGGLARVVVSSVPFLSDVTCTREGGSSIGTVQNIQGMTGTAQCVLQGDFLVMPLGLVATTVGAVGKLGALLDWHICGQNAVGGDTLGTLDWIVIGTGTSQMWTMWPWDGTTSPVLT